MACTTVLRPDFGPRAALAGRGAAGKAKRLRGSCFGGRHPEVSLPSGLVGGARGAPPRSKLSMMIMGPPQRGQGWERAGVWSASLVWSAPGSPPTNSSIWSGRSPGWAGSGRSCCSRSWARPCSRPGCDCATDACVPHVPDRARAMAAGAFGANLRAAAGNPAPAHPTATRLDLAGQGSARRPPEAGSSPPATVGSIIDANGDRSRPVCRHRDG